VVQLLAGVVVAGDHHRVGAPVLVTRGVPLIDQRLDCLLLLGVDGDGALFVVER
jgi:hypothetical protein